MSSAAPLQFKIADFTILREIGRGATAVVYECQRGDDFYAVKYMNSKDNQDKIRESINFRKEAAVLSKVNHPSLVRLVEVGESDGRPFIAMELVRGCDLREKLKQGPLSEEYLVEMLLNLARGLAYIHRLGLVHHDIKPENILINGDNEFKIIDFGFAQAKDFANISSEEAAGTLFYTAPETLKNENPDARCDLYSLGVLAYECLLGEKPFVAEVAKLIQLIQQGQYRPILEAKPEANPVLASIVQKLMAARPEDRYQSAEGLVADLENLSQLSQQHANGNLILDRTSELVKVTYEVQLVGREEEIKKLIQAWQQCRTSSGLVVQIEGEGGSGKSRLTQELLNVCREDEFLLLRGKCQQNDITPLAVLRQCLDDYVLRLSKMPDEQRQAALSFLRNAAGQNAAVLKRVSSGMAKIFSDVPNEALVDAITERQRLLASMSQFLLEMAGGQTPLLVLIDDSQWIDTISLEVLRLVAAKLKSSRMMILSTARNDEESIAAATKFAQDLGGGEEQRLVLRPLSLEAVGQFAKALLGGRELDSVIIEKLSHITNGNIFALREYILSMIDQGMLTPTATGWKVNMEQFNDLAVSGNVLQLIVNRLKYLSSEATRILGLASVMGMSFDRKLLAQVSETSQKQIEQIVREASHINLLEVEDEIATFVHDRIREALSQTLQGEELKNANQAIADVLDQTPSDSPEIVFALAQHYIHGHPERNYSRAFHATYRAGQMALDNFANSQAFDLLNQALQYRNHCPDNDVMPDQLYEAIGLAYFRLGKMDLAFENLKIALQEAKNPQRIGEVTANMCEALDSLGQYDSTPEAKGAFEYLELGLAALSKPIPKNKILFVLQILMHWLQGLFMIRTGIGFGTIAGKELERFKCLSRLYEIGTLMAFREQRFPLMAYYVTSNLYHGNRIGASREAAVADHLYCWLMGVLGFRKASTDAAARAIAISEQIGDRPALLLSRNYLAMALIIMNIRREYDELSKTVYDDMRRYLPGHRSTAYSPVGHFHHLHLKGATRELLPWAMDRYPVLEKFGNLNFLLKANTILYVDACLAERADLVKEILESRERVLAKGYREIFEPIKQLMINLSEIHVDYAKGIAKPDLLVPVADEVLKWSSANFYFREFALVVAYANRLLFNSESAEIRQQAFNECKRVLQKKVFFLKKTPVHRAHLMILKAAMEDFSGKTEKALAYLQAAEVDAQEADSDWARFEIAREKARIHQKQEVHSLHEQFAREALSIATRQGWLLYMKRVREEFGLQDEIKPTPSGATASDMDQRVLSHYLESLLRVSLASASSINPDDQAKAALDELIKVLGADRAFLFRSADGTHKELNMHVGRDAAGNSLTELKGYSSTVVKLVCKDRRAMVVSGTDEGRLLGSESAILHNLRSIMAAPLMIQNRLMGAVYIDSKASNGLFTAEDLRFLEAIVNHIAIAIQLSFLAQNEAQRRILEKDMELASAVQSFFLPTKNDLVSSTFHLCANYEAATHVSGDWWWHEVDEKNGISLLLGDVMGHGAAPAMLTASICSQYRLLKKTNPEASIKDIMKSLNEEFRAIARGDYLMTMLGIHIDNNGKLALYNASSPPFLVLKNSGEVEMHTCAGSPLGRDDFDLEDYEVQLEKGDRLLVATDGLFEMTLAGGSVIRNRQITNLFKKTKGMPTQQAVEFFLKELRDLRGGVHLKDDVTILFVDYQPETL